MSARSHLASLVQRLRQRLARVHPRPVFVLGNQKSGTSAIAGLLGQATGLQATLDIPGIHGDEQRRLHAGETRFMDFVATNRLDFSRPIIKEPALTFLVQALEQAFPHVPLAFVVRDPRANVRSILNRLHLPGDKGELGPEELERVQGYGPNWRRMLEGWLGATGDTYVERLGSRWNVAAQVYLARPERFELLRYEDFVANKERTIADLAKRLGLEPRHPLGDRADHPFQPAGDRTVTPLEFFGERNLARLEATCAGPMGAFGYDPTG